MQYTLDTPGREITVWMTGFGDSSLNFTLGVWVQPEQVKRPTALVSDYLWAIDDAFKKCQIEIRFRNAISICAVALVTTNLIEYFHHPLWERNFNVGSLNGGKHGFIDL